MSVEESTVVAAVLEPISGERPCGVDVTYDDDFQQLKSAVDGLSAARSGEVDYERLVALGSDLLTRRSKDLRVAVFMAFGLERTRGAAGLADGLGIVDGVTRTFWSDLFPPRNRMAGRQNALQSLSDRLKERITDGRYEAPDRPYLERAREHLGALQQFTLAEMGENAPALSGLLQSIDEALRRVPAAPGSQSGGTTNGAASDQPAPARTAPAPSVAPSPAPDASFEKPADAIRAVQRAAEFLLEIDRTDPLPYLLMRDVQWAPLDSAPPNEGGRTLIPSPPGQMLEQLDLVAAGGDAAALVEVAEGLFQEFPLLLDAQRHLAQALEKLGGQATAARNAVAFSLARLLRVIPDLPELSFSDGTPFADGATRAWIQSTVQALAAGDANAAATAGSGSSSATALDEAYGRASSRLATGDVRGALAEIRQGSEQDRSGSARFRRQFMAARLCMTAGQYGLARPLLEGLDQEVERHDLAHWEPALATEVWTLLYQCLQALVKTAEAAAEMALRQQSERVFDRICRLDATHALTLLGKT